MHQRSQLCLSAPCIPTGTSQSLSLSPVTPQHLCAAFCAAVPQPPTSASQHPTLPPMTPSATATVTYHLRLCLLPQLPHAAPPRRSCGRTCATILPAIVFPPTRQPALRAPALHTPMRPRAHATTRPRDHATPRPRDPATPRPRDPATPRPRDPVPSDYPAHASPRCASKLTLDFALTAARSHPIPPNKISYKTRGVKLFEQHDCATFPGQYRVGKLGQNFATAIALAGGCFSYSDSLCLLLYWCVVTYMHAQPAIKTTPACFWSLPALPGNFLPRSAPALSQNYVVSLAVPACSEHAQ